MSQQKLLERVVQSLERLSIPYMITGSVASSLQGEPRSTHDIDIVVLLKKVDVKRLAQDFPAPDFFLDEQSALEAVETETMFNLIHVKEGDKIDFWLLRDDPFDQSRFSRKYKEECFGFKVYVPTPEDTILAKLRWAKLCGGSEKQFTDALRVYEIQYGKLNLSYLEHWSSLLGLDDLWKRLKEEAESE